MGTNPIKRPHSPDLPEALPPNTTPSRVRISTCDFRGDTNLQTIPGLYNRRVFSIKDQTVNILGSDYSTPVV